MHPHRDLPSVADAPPTSFDGHLWIQEWVPGGVLRVQVAESGLLRFADEGGAFDHGDVPPGYRHAVRHVRERFDRDALRRALDDVESATFVLIATRLERDAYEWAELPAALGVDVIHSAGGSEGRALPPDAVERLYDRLGLAVLPAVEKEVRTDAFDPDTYELPPSRWRDGAAAGVVIRNKTGDRALLRDDETRVSEPIAFGADLEALAADLVTEERLERARRSVGEGDSADPAAVAERVFELIAREEYARLFGEDAGVDADSVRTAVADHVRDRLDAGRAG